MFTSRERFLGELLATDVEVDPGPADYVAVLVLDRQAAGQDGMVLAVNTPAAVLAVPRPLLRTHSIQAAIRALDVIRVEHSRQPKPEHPAG